MLQGFLRRMETLLPDGGRVLAAVSGGADSMCLASLLEESGLPWAAAHCNFHLRGAESDGDEAFVRAWAEEHGVKLYVKHFETAAYAEREGVSIEMAARAQRYAWFAELCRTEGFAAVATAHNANDNAETLVLNLLRGTGSRGMRGIPAAGTLDGVRVIRPLLGAERAAIEARLRERGLAWREDSTNRSGEYRRNRIRGAVFPVFAELNPGFVRTLNADIDRLIQTDDIAEDYFQSVRGSVAAPDGSIDLAELRALKHWRYVLYRLAGSTLGEDALRSLTAALEHGSPAAGKRFGPYVVSRGKLMETGADVPAAPVFEVFDRPAGFDPHCGKGTLVLDAARLGDAPQVRPWEPGDWMVPLGMRGKKKLSDLFTDLKWSAEDKRRARVIPCPGEKGRVAALLYERIDDSFKVTAATARILRVRAAETTTE